MNATLCKPASLINIMMMMQRSQFLSIMIPLPSHPYMGMIVNTSSSHLIIYLM